MRVKAVIFDMDGTLIDSVDLHARAWSEALSHFGKQVSFEEARSQIGKGGDQLLPHFLSEDEVHRIGEQLKEYRSQLFKREYMAKIRPFPGVRELFTAIRARGQKTALATSSPKDDLQVYKRLVNIEDLVDKEITADDVDKSKPHPDVYQVALDELSVAPSKAIAIGDSPYDAEAARKAGIRPIGFRCGGFPEADLRAAGCVALYDSPEDLLRHLDSSPLAQP